MVIRKFAASICGVLVSAALLALPGVSAADTSTPVTCKDGTTSPHGGRGACSGHGGIDKKATAATGASSSGAGTPSASGASGGAGTSGAATAPAPAPGASTHPSSTQATTSHASSPSQAAAPGGGPGLVWVNSASKVYHCSSDRWYGKTKQGEYMTEAEAKSKGNRPDHNKPCS